MCASQPSSLSRASRQHGLAREGLCRGWGNISGAANSTSFVSFESPCAPLNRALSRKLRGNTDWRVKHSVPAGAASVVQRTPRLPTCLNRPGRRSAELSRKPRGNMDWRVKHSVPAGAVSVVQRTPRVLSRLNRHVRQSAELTRKRSGKLDGRVKASVLLVQHAAISAGSNWSSRPHIWRFSAACQSRRCGRALHRSSRLGRPDRRDAKAS